MVALLLIRGITDIPFAVTAVNEFLAYRRSGNGLARSSTSNRRAFRLRIP